MNEPHDPNASVNKRAQRRARRMLVGLRGKARARLAKEPAEFATAEADLLSAGSAVAKVRGEKDPETREWTV
jgi:hypothetical protein